MKRTVLSTTLMTILAIAPLAAAQGNGYGRGNAGRHHGQRGAQGGACHQALLSRLATLPTTTLSDAEKASLLHMRQEEKLARDVYTTLAERWQTPVFANIARAEQQHLELMGLLLERYEIPDPIADTSPGQFSDPEMAALFTRFSETGRTSLADALTVGATIEDLDLADLNRLLEQTQSPDLLLVANNLAKGSRNHLRAFNRNLEANGLPAYSAQHLSQAQVDEILAGEHERRVAYDETGAVLTSCGSCRGQGRGQKAGCMRGAGQGAQGRGQQGCPRGTGQGRQGQGGGPRDGSCQKISP